MLHVKIDLVPFGQEEGRRTLSEIFIANKGDADEGLTKYAIWYKDPRFSANPKEPNETCLHFRDDGCEALAIIALKKLGYGNL